VKWNEQFVSIPKGEDPLSVDVDRAIELISQKQQADAPIAAYKGKPVTKGKGRFGPFIKYDNLFINVPKAYNFDNLSQREIEELITKKLEKEANRYIQQWSAEKIAIENGRWGPFIRFGKKMLKLQKNANGEKYTVEELADISLDEVKKMILVEVPGAFEKKSSRSKKSTTKKSVAKESN
jgi:DNA topoisomerase-1